MDLDQKDKKTQAAVTLILDVRERGLAAELTRAGVPYTTAALDVGDFLIQNAEGEPLLVAERKSQADFAASNTDGRYREQRARLMAVRGSGVAVVYILEGALVEDKLKRLTTRLLLRYSMPTLFSNSIADTAGWCRLLLKQLTEDETVFQPDSEGATTSAMSGFTAALNTVKKGNKTAGGTAQAMMSAVPGLGAKRVAALLAEKSIVELATMSVTEIAAITAGGKRIGDKLAETLHAAIHFK